MSFILCYLYTKTYYSLKFVSYYLYYIIHIQELIITYYYYTGIRDDLKSPSARIVVGRVVGTGTGSFDLLQPLA